MLKVAMLDDHYSFLESLSSRIENIAPKIKFALIETESKAFMQKLADANPDVVILDIQFDNDYSDGFRICEEIQALSTKLPVMFLSGKMDSASIRAAFRRGALGYVSKAAKPSEIVTAIKTVSKSQKYVGESLRTVALYDILGTENGSDEKQQKEALTEREKSIMILIARGLMIQEIADKLSVSPKTITSHTSNIRRKTGLANDVQITKYVLREGWITFFD